MSGKYPRTIFESSSRYALSACFQRRARDHSESWTNLSPRKFNTLSVALRVHRGLHSGRLCNKSDSPPPDSPSLLGQRAHRQSHPLLYHRPLHRLHSDSNSEDSHLQTHLCLLGHDCSAGCDGSKSPLPESDEPVHRRHLCGCDHGCLHPCDPDSTGNVHFVPVAAE